MNQTITPILLVTGMSGAGMSSALKVLEDLGYEIIDNLPFRLFPTLLNDQEFTRKPLAIGVDTRNRDFEATEILVQIRALDARPDLKTSLVFLECEDDRLIERFKTNRRRHPLALNCAIREGIEKERDSLRLLKDAADHVIDTTFFSVKELKTMLTGHFKLHEREMTLSVLSFSYRRGIPREADMVFDVRFLRNPYYDSNLRPLDGRSPLISEYIQKDASLNVFMVHLQDMLRHLIDRFEEEGKSYLTIAFGCTGGRHRSVFVAEQIVAWLGQTHEHIVFSHRDMVNEGVS